MRSTLDIEMDVLSAVKEIARQKNVGLGKVVSELLRQALMGNTGPAAKTQPSSPSAIGFDPFASRGVTVTNDLINRLRDAEGI